MANSLNTNGMNLKIGITYSEDEARAKLNSVLNKLELKSTIQIPVEIDGERFVKTIRTYQDEMKNLVEDTTLYNGAGKTFSQTISNITTAEERANAAIARQTNNTKQLTTAQQQLNSTTKHGVSIFQDFTNTFLKMAKFNTINLIYDGIINKMSEAIQITNDFDAAMTEFKKVTDTTNLSLSDYTEQLGELGEATARTTTQMLQSATEFSKAGFTPEESAQLAQIASLYQNIADAEISAGEAASFITSQIKAFKDYGVEANNATQIIDKLNEVKLFVTS
jgi:hypothetical protein